MMVLIASLLLDLEHNILIEENDISKEAHKEGRICRTLKKGDSWKQNYILNKKIRSLKQI